MKELFKFRLDASVLILLCACLLTTSYAAPKSNTCETEACKKLASDIRNYMNESINPCDDFYGYVCGNFGNKVIIRDGADYNFSISNMNDKLLKQLRTSIENEISDSDPQALKKLKSFYEICRDEEKIDKNSNSEFLNLLKELGGWPVLEGSSWDSSKFDWKNTIYALRQKGYFVNSLVTLEVEPDFNNNSRKIIHVLQPKFEHLARKYLADNDEKLQRAYLKYMNDLVKIFNANNARVDLDLKDILDLEIKLAKISLMPVQSRDMRKTCKQKTIKELQENYPYFPWFEYLSNFAAPYHTVSEDESVIMCGSEYFEKLGDIFTETLEKNPRALANELIWWAVAKSADYLDSRVLQAKRDFKRVVLGIKAGLPRWEECVINAKAQLPIAMGALYVRRHVKPETKTSVTDIVKDIRKSFAEILKELEWMDEETRAQAVIKLQFILPLIAYPEQLLDDEKLDEYHESLNINKEKSFLKAALNAGRFSRESLIKTLDEPNDKSDWREIFGRSAVINAFYRPWLNAIFVPAGIIQAPFFHSDFPNYVNYAGIGFVVGHEFTHIFDDLGSQFDKDGHLKDWWKPETKEIYNDKKECIIKQYSNYILKEEYNLHLNGAGGQGENIADNGGIKIAYNAWKKRNFNDPSLPGFESFSPEKMFWISNAHQWCAKYRPEYVINLVKTDNHSPNEFRVNGPHSNRPEFAADFNCPVGTFMNPANKCSVW